MMDYGALVRQLMMHAQPVGDKPKSYLKPRPGGGPRPGSADWDKLRAASQIIKERMALQSQVPVVPILPDQEQ